MSIAAPIQGIKPSLGKFAIGIISTDTNNTARYHPLDFSSTTTYTGTEASSRLQVDFKFLLKSIRLNVITNTKDGNTIVSFRDDGVSLGSITIAAGGTGTFASTDINQVVASGSLCNWKVDLSGSTSGNFGSTIGYAFYEVLSP